MDRGNPEDTATAMSVVRVLLLPGWLDSGPGHWQTLWEQQHGWERVVQADWVWPRRGDWMARLDEARDGTLIQVVDVATPPEKKSKPKRALIAVGVGAAPLLLLIVWWMLRHVLRQGDPSTGTAIAGLRAALSRR